MIFSKLQEIVQNKAFTLKQNAEYSGAWNDGGSASLLAKLLDYKNGLIVKYDLRPSEYIKLNVTEVGEPLEFIYIIEEYKHNLALDFINYIKI